MAGETIIVADDKPVSLKLIEICLAFEGYKVIPASSGSQALELLNSVNANLVFADLPDEATLELARRLKGRREEPHVLALVASHPEMQDQVIAAGCDGCVLRPVEVSQLGARIRETLERRGLGPAPVAQPEPAKAAAASSVAAPAAAVEPAAQAAVTEMVEVPAAQAAGFHAGMASETNGAGPQPGVLNETPKSDAARRDEAAAELENLRHRFLSEGREKSRDLLLQLNGRFDVKEAAKAVHQWIGTGGLLGFAAVSRLSREAEQILRETPLDNFELRETLGKLTVAFNSPEEARDEPVPDSIVEALAGKRIVAVDFNGQEQERLRAALLRVGAQAVFLSLEQAQNSDQAAAAELLLVHVTPEGAESGWLSATGAFSGGRSVVLTGTRDDLVALPAAAQGMAREFLMDSWQQEEALVRLSLAAAPREASAAGPAKPTPVAGARPKVAIADDDPAMLSLVRTALENFGMECYSANNGTDAIETIRKVLPQAAVLDVNMPGMDGYEVLAAVRRDELPVRVLLLTARQQESDVIRGFTLGADDYVVKPFSPMELVARLKRLLSR